MVSSWLVLMVSSWSKNKMKSQTINLLWYMFPNGFIPCLDCTAYHQWSKCCKGQLQYFKKLSVITPNFPLGNYRLKRGGRIESNMSSIWTRTSSLNTILSPDKTIKIINMLQPSRNCNGRTLLWESSKVIDMSQSCNYISNFR